MSITKVKIDNKGWFIRFQLSLSKFDVSNFIIRKYKIIKKKLRRKKTITFDSKCLFCKSANCCKMAFSSAISVTNKVPFLCSKNKAFLPFIFCLYFNINVCTRILSLSCDYISIINRIELHIQFLIKLISALSPKSQFESHYKN